MRLTAEGERLNRSVASATLDWAFLGALVQQLTLEVVVLHAARFPEEPAGDAARPVQGQDGGA
jgi:hypothetical protein